MQSLIIGDKQYSVACGYTKKGYETDDGRNADDLVREENREYAARAAASQGLLYYKYIPKSGIWGTPDVEYPVLNPKGDTTLKVLQTWSGDGTITFHRPTWQEMPTQYMIVNALADLEVKKVIGTRVIKTLGGKDLSDVRILS